MGEVVPVHVDEAKDTGTFREEHECNHCGAKLFVEGREEQPSHEWTRYGSAIE